jgi:hypothetical protein
MSPGRQIQESEVDGMRIIKLTGFVQFRFSWGYVLLRKPSHWRYGGMILKVRRYCRPVVFH